MKHYISTPKKPFYKNYFETHKSNSNKKWKIIGNIIFKKKKIQQWGYLSLKNHTTYTNQKFNKFYTTIAGKLVSN